MNKKLQNTTLGIIGVITLLATLSVYYFMHVEQTPANICAILFVLASECIFFGGLFALGNNNALSNSLFAKSGIISSLTLCLLVTIVLALFIGAFKNALNVYIIIQIIIFLVFTIAILSLIAFAKMISSSN